MPTTPVSPATSHQRVGRSWTGAIAVGTVGAAESARSIETREIFEIGSVDASSSSSANARSVADWKRASGRFSRQRITTRASDLVAPFGGSGVVLRIAYDSSTGDADANARRPQIIS